MHSPRTNQSQRARAVAVLTALIALTACGSDDTTARTSSTPLQTPADATEQPTSVAQPPATDSTPTTESTLATESTDAAEPTPDEPATARAALLQPTDLGAGWQDLGADFAFPMTAELAASVPTCAPFVDVSFEGSIGVWASTALSRNTDIAFASVALFPTVAEATAMVAATATPEFDQCWADLNEAAAVALPFGIESASYESVVPPDIALGGDSSSLHALDGTITLGSTDVPDTCVCAFVQQGRAVVSFHSAEPVFSAAEREDVIAAALARVDRTVD